MEIATPPPTIGTIEECMSFLASAWCSSIEARASATATSSTKAGL